MAFPQSVLGISVELNLGGTWTDITSYVRSEQGISITRGKGSEASSTDPGRCNFTLDNTDGRFSPRLPTSPYYGLLGRNTPVRVAITGGETYLNLPGGSGDRISTPDNAALDITGDLDVRMEASFEDWHVTTETELMGKYLATGNQRSWRLTLDEDGYPKLTWSTDGSALLSATATRRFQGGATGRFAVRATLDVNNGLGGYTVTFYIARTIDGPWDELGDATVTTAGTTSIFSSTATLQIGDISALGLGVPTGKVHAVEVRDGIDGTEVANPDFSNVTAGTSSFADPAGRTWTVAGNATVSNRQIRFVGEVSSWPLAWDTGGFDVTTSVEASGIMRRLGQNAPPLDSALKRTISTTSDVVAYWPLEDAVGTTESASPIDDVDILEATDFTFESEQPTFGAGLPAGSGTLPALGDAAEMSAPVPSFSSTSWQVEFLFKVPTAPSTLRSILCVKSTGTVKLWRIQLDTTNARLRGEDSDGTAIFTDDVASGGIPGGWRRCRLSVAQNGGNVDYNVQWRRLGGTSINTNTGSFAGTVGRPTRIQSPPGGYSSDLDGMGIGHIAVRSNSSASIFTDADVAYNGERASDRIERLSAEENIPAIVTGTGAAEVSVGPQGQATFLSLVSECTDADQGLLFERRGSTALCYRDLSQIYDQGVTLTLDYSASEVAAPFLPVDDDQNVANDITVQRQYGSFGRSVDEDSALSIQEPPDGVGQYAQTYTYNLSQDEDARQIAGWKLLLGTWDEARYPQVRVNIAHDPALMEDAARVELGDRIVVENPPSWLPPDPIDLLVIGYTEEFAQYAWDITYVCVPYGPYNTGHVEEESYSRVDTAGCELAEDLDTTETGVDVTTTATYRWVDSATYPDDFPFDIVVGGERMTVTACTGTTTSQTFTVTRSVNGVVKTHSTGADVRIYRPAYVAL